MIYYFNKREFSFVEENFKCIGEFFLSFEYVFIFRSFLFECGNLWLFNVFIG